MINKFFERFLLKRYHNLNLAPRVELTNYQKNAIEKFKTKLKKGIYKKESVGCLCGSKKSFDFASLDRFSIPCKTKLCLNCGLFRISPRLDFESNNSFYKFDYRNIYIGDNYNLEQFFYFQKLQGKKILNYVNDYLPLNNECVVFEVGCGAGGILMPFKDANHKVFGCDLGKDYLDFGIDKGLDLYNGDIETLSKKPKCDLIILSHVLEHFMHPFEEIKKMKSYLKQGGMIYIEVPGAREAYKQFGADLLNYFQNAHIFNFTLENLTYFMNREGFRLVKSNHSIQAIYVKDENLKITNNNFKVKKLIFYIYFHELLRKLGFPVVLLYPKTYIRNILKKLNILNFYRNINS